MPSTLLLASPDFQNHPCDQVFTNDDQMLIFCLSYFITTVPWILHNGKYLQKYASHFSHGNLIFFRTKLGFLKEANNSKPAILLEENYRRIL